MLYAKPKVKRNNKITKTTALKIKRINVAKPAFKVGIAHNKLDLSLVEYYQRAFNDSTINNGFIQPKLQARVLKAKAAIKNKKTVVLVKGDERFSGFDQKILNKAIKRK